MSRTPSRGPLAVGTAVGIALLAVGGTLVLRPAAVLDRVPDLAAPLERVDPEIAVIVLAAAVGVVVPALAVANRWHASAPPSLVEESASGGDAPARSATASRSTSRSRGPGATPNGDRRGRPVAGAELDARIRRATAYERVPREARESERAEIVDALRTIAADVYARQSGCALEAATTAIDDGAWTDDPRAAAFLAGEDGPSTPVTLWLLDLLTAADPFVRALERAISEVEALQSRPAGPSGSESEVNS